MKKEYTVKLNDDFFRKISDYYWFLAKNWAKNCEPVQLFEFVILLILKLL